MLTIRMKQKATLVNEHAETWKCDFCTSEISKCGFCRILLSAYPETTRDLSLDDRRHLIFQGIEKARAYGFRQRSNVERFIHLMFVLGRERIDALDKDQSAANILDWKGVAEAEKMAALEKWGQKVVISELQKRRLINRYR
jgi:hypothetical protein